MTARWCVIALTGLTMTVSGCGGSKSSNRLDVELPGGVRMTADEEGISLPDDFPSDVPIYPGSKATALLGGKDQGQQISMVSFEANASINEVTTFYEEKLEEHGWTIAGNVKTADGALLTASKDNKLSMTLTVAKGENKDGAKKTNIAMNLGRGS